MSNIIILDTETTGTDPQVDRLVELAGIPLNPTCADFSVLVNPERDIPPEAKAIHHITEADVKDAPFEVDAYFDMLHHFGEEELVAFCAHNAKFDKAFIDRISQGNFLLPWICTYKGALTFLPEAPGHSNQVLRYWLGLEIDTPPGLFPHRALYDCYVTREILRELLKHGSVRDLVEITQNPVLLRTVTFGKHKGKLWSEVDYGYLKWVLGPTGLTDNADALFTAQHYIKRFKTKY